MAGYDEGQAMTTSNVKLLPLHMLQAFQSALKGQRGEMDAWLEVNNEADVRLHVEAYVEASTEALRADVERLTGCLATANANHEHFERQWYLEQDRAERLAEALQWYAEQAALCRKLGADGDRGRQALDADGGKRAYAALHPTAAQEAGND